MTNIPLIQGNSVQEINTSIIAIKKAQKELETLNTQIDNKIKALNLALSGGPGKYIESIQEVQGLIKVTEGSITDTIASGNSQPATSNGVADAISTEATARDNAIKEASKRTSIYPQNLNNFNGAWYMNEKNYEGIFFLGVNSLNAPVSSPYSWFVKTMNKEYSAGRYVITQIAINADPKLIYTRFALSEDNQTWNWNAWQEVRYDSILTTFTVDGVSFTYIKSGNLNQLYFACPSPVGTSKTYNLSSKINLPKSNAVFILGNNSTSGSSSYTNISLTLALGILYTTGSLTIYGAVGIQGSNTPFSNVHGTVVWIS